MAAAHGARTGLLAGLVACLLLVWTSLAPAPVAAASPKDGQLHATLDGKPIPLAEVGKHYCHDFAYPEIRCYSSALVLETSTATTQVLSLLAGVTYVTVYEYTSYQGAYMHISEDYSALWTIGWNDRISSYVARNYESGAFFTDWLYGGTRWNFCCNSSVSNLGGYDNTFSSVFRT